MEAVIEMKMYTCNNVRDKWIWSVERGENEWMRKDEDDDDDDEME